MSSSTSKRPRTRSPSPTLPLHLLTSRPSASTFASSDPALARLLPSVALGVQAHEATLLDAVHYSEIRRLNESRAQEDEEEQLGDVTVNTTAKKGRLIRWTGQVGPDAQEVWTDRYDILHLITAIPTRASDSSSPRPTWSDPRGFAHLPATHEEMFYFTPAERADIVRRSKRRQVEDERDARVQAAMERDEAERVRAETQRAEETAAQLALMRKLHTTLSSSPNPSLLEMRILAHHGADPRFAFLRRGARGGPWRHTWERLRRGEQVGDVAAAQESTADASPEVSGGGGMAGLAAYGSSDEEGEEETEERPASDEATVGRDTGTAESEGHSEPDLGATVDTADDPAAQERASRQEGKARKAREWARQRREAREAAAMTERRPE